MAKLTEQRKKALIADLETKQYSVRELAKKYNVSNATVQKYKQFINEESEQVVNAGIAYKMGLSKIAEPERVNAIMNAVDERTRQLIYFQNSSLKNQEIANRSLDALEATLMQIEDDSEKNALMMKILPILKDHANITKTNKETVLGKDVETVINNTNAQQNNEQSLKIEFIE